jgi:hypothetical protein
MRDTGSPDSAAVVLSLDLPRTRSSLLGGSAVASLSHRRLEIESLPAMRLNLSEDGAFHLE